MALGHGPQFFPNTSNSVIINPTITVHRDPYHNPAERFGLQQLLKYIAKGAFHDAAERGDPPRCHPHTCTAIRADIMKWIKAPRAMRKLILWMHGPAGAGKTAIAQSIAEECARLGLLAASFFFWRTAPERNNASRFVPTLAYQLSLWIPQIQEHLFAAIERDPTIFTRSLSTQMRVLVIDPLKLAAPSLSIPIFALVDGLDECGPDDQAQSELLHLLGSVALELQHLPLIFLIASRPEYQIREAFNGNILNPLAQILALDNGYKPDEDIKLYFDSKFRDISEEHRRLGRRLPSPWPTANDVHSLVSKASGQFIFAATVTKFINSPRHNPADRMDIVLRLSTSGNETPFALLDELYRFILDSVADVEGVLDILAFLFLNDGGMSALDEAEDLLGIEFRSPLVDMHSLVCVPPPSDTNAELPTVYHASLEDFLMDRSRSRQHYIGESEGHLRITRCCWKTLRRYFYLQCKTKEDAISFFGSHGKQSPATEDLVNDLAQFDLRALLEGNPADVLHVYWQGFLDGAKKLAGSDRLDIFLRLQNDFNMFLLDRIAPYPLSLQAHIPVILCNIDHDFCYFFRILLRGASNTAEEYKELLDLDRRLLHIYDAAFTDIPGDEVYDLLFKDETKAGKHFVGGESYAALVKAIVSVIYSKPGDKNHPMRLSKTEYYLYDCDLSLSAEHFKCLTRMLEKASTNWDLASFLLECVVQFQNDMERMPWRREMGKASIKYIQRCGIPFLEHSHQPDTNECAICSECDDAIVVENIPDVPMELPLLTSIEDLNDFLAAVGMVDGVPAYPFTHRMEMSVAPNGALMYSFVGEPPFGYLM